MPLILAFLGAIPALWSMFLWIKEQTKESPVAYLKKIQDTIDFLRSATTSEQKAEAAKRVQDLIKS